MSEAIAPRGVFDFSGETFSVEEAFIFEGDCSFSGEGFSDNRDSMSETLLSISSLNRSEKSCLFSFTGDDSLVEAFLYSTSVTLLLIMN